MDLVLYLPDLALVVACPLPPGSMMPHWTPTQSCPPNPNGLMLTCPNLEIFHEVGAGWPKPEVGIRDFTDSKGHCEMSLLRELRPGDPLGVLLSLDNSLTKLGPVQAVQLFDNFMWPIHLSQHPASTADLELPMPCELGSDPSYQLRNLCKTLYFEEVTEVLLGDSYKNYLILFHTERFEMIDSAKMAVLLPREGITQEPFYALVQVYGAPVGTSKSSIQYITYGKATPLSTVMDAHFDQLDDKSNLNREVHIDINIKIKLVSEKDGIELTAVAVTQFALSSTYTRFSQLVESAPAIRKDFTRYPMWFQVACGLPGLKAIQCLPEACPPIEAVAQSTFDTRAAAFAALGFLNKEQYDAMKAGLTTSRLTLVQGPPGTGKSRLLAIYTEVGLAFTFGSSPSSLGAVLDPCKATARAATKPGSGAKKPRQDPCDCQQQ